MIFLIQEAHTTLKPTNGQFIKDNSLKYMIVQKKKGVFSKRLFINIGEEDDLIILLIHN